MVPLLGSAKPFLGSLTLCNIVENDNPTLQRAICTSERSARNANQTASRHMLVANENLYIVNTFTAHGSHERQLMGWIRSDPVRHVSAILIGPIVRSGLRRTDPQDLFSSRIEEEKLPIRIGHNHAIGDTSQNQLQEFLLPCCFLFRPFLFGDVPENKHYAKPFS